MTDWLDEILDCNTAEPVPEGFVAQVLERTRVEEVCAEDASVERSVASSSGRLFHFSQRLGWACAAALLLTVGFWLGHGAQPLHFNPVLGSGPENASLDLEALYQHREVLEAFDILADQGLEEVFLDAESGTWTLDYVQEVAR